MCVSSDSRTVFPRKAKFFENLDLPSSPHKIALVKCERMSQLSSLPLGLMVPKQVPSRCMNDSPCAQPDQTAADQKELSKEVSGLKNFKAS